jgi:hypothetical protein
VFVWVLADYFLLVYGLTHSALGLYGLFVVRFRLWYSHSLMRKSIQPLSWYAQPHGNLLILLLRLGSVLLFFLAMFFACLAFF